MGLIYGINPVHEAIVSGKTINKLYGSNTNVVNNPPIIVPNKTPDIPILFISKTDAIILNIISNNGMYRFFSKSEIEFLYIDMICIRPVK